MITYMTIGLIAMTGILMVLLILWSKLRYFYISYCLGIASDRYHCDIVLRVDFSPCWGSCCCCRLILIFFFYEGFSEVAAFHLSIDRLFSSICLCSKFFLSSDFSPAFLSM